MWILIIAFPIGIVAGMVLCLPFWLKRKKSKIREIARIGLLKSIIVSLEIFLLIAFMIEYFRNKESIYLIISGLILLVIILVFDGFKKWKRKIERNRNLVNDQSFRPYKG